MVVASLSSTATKPQLLGLRVAGLEVWSDARGSGLTLGLAGCHVPFQVAEVGGDALWLKVRDGPLRSTEGWQPLIMQDGSWQLWRDGAGRRVFVPPPSLPPPRQIAVDASYRSGEVLGPYGVAGSAVQPAWPLDGLDMRLYVNWLAETGDLLVHASGIDDDGRGFVFVGPSGAGKSTLAADLAARYGSKVLGEDQVIVRRQQGRFLVYGTPWHTNLERCAPGGVPLAGLFFLERESGRGVGACGPGEGVQRLLQNALVPWYNREGAERILDSLPHLAEQVPFHLLDYRRGSDILALVREA